jgi:hypothetical protein
MIRNIQINILMGSNIVHVTNLMANPMLIKNVDDKNIIPRMISAGIKINPKSTTQYH